MTDQTLQLIAKDLCLINVKTNEVIKQHAPFTKIAEFKRVKNDIIIIREETDSYDLVNSNIYCIDDDLETKWFSERESNDDCYPNDILWNKSLNDNATSWSDYTISDDNSLVCSSQRGITVAIDYDSGKIIQSTFTK